MELNEFKDQLRAEEGGTSGSDINQVLKRGTAMRRRRQAGVGAVTVLAVGALAGGYAVAQGSSGEVAADPAAAAGQDARQHRHQRHDDPSMHVESKAKGGQRRLMQPGSACGTIAPFLDCDPRKLHETKDRVVGSPVDLGITSHGYQLGLVHQKANFWDLRTGKRVRNGDVINLVWSKGEKQRQGLWVSDPGRDPQGRGLLWGVHDPMDAVGYVKGTDIKQVYVINEDGKRIPAQGLSTEVYPGLTMWWVKTSPDEVLKGIDVEAVTTDGETITCTDPHGCIGSV